MTNGNSDDVRAIEALISRQFSSMTWARGGTPDQETFKQDFHPEATLYPAARPAQMQTVDVFLSRISEMSGDTLLSFTETVVDTKVQVFGNVAVAVAGCEITENETEFNRGVEMLLLVKSGGRWQIASQAWDTEAPDNAG